MLRTFLDSVFGGAEPQSDRRDAEMLALSVPCPGTVLAFRTSPFCDLSPRPTGRFAAIKILVAERGVVSFGVLAGVWSAVPALQEVVGSRIVRQRSFAWPGKLAAFGVTLNHWDTNDLEDLVTLGAVRVTGAERRLGLDVAGLGRGARYGRLAMASDVAEGEWRWRYDRAAVIAECERSRREADAVVKGRSDQRAAWLAGLTLDALLASNPFPDWSGEERHLPHHFVEGARTAMRHAYERLGAFRGRPSKAKTRALLRELVLWFNEADRVSGTVIETREREEICLALEEVATVAGHGKLITEIDAWREW